MNTIRILRPRFVLRQLTAWTAVLCSIGAAANTFDDGITNSISVDTVYNEPVYVGVFTPSNGL